MAYGHAERNLALIRQLEAETTQLLDSLPELDPEESASETDPCLLSGGRTAYWSDSTVVIRNPRATDGGTAFCPTNGYDYFLGLH